VTIDPELTRLLEQITDSGQHIGAADETNFEFGLQAILDRASRLIDDGSKLTRATRTAAKASGGRGRRKAAARK
jgi:hypothetical protein